ncbi:hypothetical protein ERJ75_001807800 [Trypanosoma vivax]|nr:hypothetical protein TRVL_06360 [Trypanosoma vivax]KAH8603564.1 hypothetical protein ERJ75_001807800 [Trypanosoma vivax]
MGGCSSSSKTRPTPQPRGNDRSAQGGRALNLASHGEPGEHEFAIVKPQKLHELGPGKVMVNSYNFDFLTKDKRDLKKAKKVIVAFDLDDEKLQKVLSLCTSAETLDFTLSGGTVTKVEATASPELRTVIGLDAFKKLERLNVTNTKVGDELTQGRAAWVKRLKYLTLDSCDRIKTFYVLAPLTNLEELYMSLCTGIQARGRTTGSETLLKLQKLKKLIADYTFIEGNVVMQLKSKFGSAFSNKRH